MTEEKKSVLDEDVPPNLTLFHVRARAYQQYVSGLKAGKRSGISDVFGSAEDIFSDETEVPPVNKMDFAPLPAGTQDERQWRALFLVNRLRKRAKDILKEHLNRCRAGQYGEKTQKAAEPKVPAELVGVMSKEICCVYLHTTWLEQGLFEAEPPQWLQELFALTVAAIDLEMDGAGVESAEETLNRFDYCEVSKLAQKLSSSIGKHLGFGIVGEPAWNDLRKQFLCDGPVRFEIISDASTLSAEQLEQSLR